MTSARSPRCSAGSAAASSWCWEPAGKTVAALLLTVELLDHPDRHEPVPILLAASSWDPTAEHFDTWAARRLDEDYPALRNARAYGRDAAARLVAEGRVMIVVDGLDELPVHLHAAALDGLNRAAGVRPVVVTCRSAEYQAAVAKSGTFLSRAAIVELAPVEPAEVAAYLAAAHLDARWTPVLGALPAGGVLAEALSSPLMVYLARTIYAAPYTDPGELLGFPTREAVEQHLVGAYLPAVYEQRPRAVDPYRPAKTPQWTVAEAGRWLRFLARRPGQEFPWWHLTAAVPRLVVVLVAVVVTYGVTAIVEVAMFGATTPLSTFFSITTGVAVLVRRRPIRPGKPSKARLGREYLPRTVGIMAGIAFFGGITVLAEQRQEGRFVLVAVVGMLALWVIVLREASRTRTDTLTDPDSRTILRDDRRLCLAWLALGVLLTPVMLLASHQRWSPVTLVVGVAVLACGGAVMRTAWVSYLVAKLWLASRGRIPWRLMTFLEDARHRGVLRANGPAYQFRHLRLQEHLKG
ncbi:hypothetical protein BBK82_36580 [Lentzea guizhouensis]|uniref:NACHT domain-containing protein n=1 Tax=Lentzea guizhouensis TaxID=1586287 RepID=A0A1B2HSJ8_9PSEU|nr:hypothetical protein [Lentzea guizhouensis]ANZ40697.1 hypothetical protein BBK82_36580 [Lentzea guizhouensis]